MKTAEALHIEPGSILLERYIVGRALGFGGFGVTYIGWDAVLEQRVAIKEYLPSEFATRIPGQSQITVFTGDKAEQFNYGLQKFIEEARRLAQFHKEDGIVRIFDSFESNNTAYIVMEYLQGETLAGYLKREKIMPVDKAITLLLPVIRSLEAVNSQGVIHRDIAPDNIFLTDDGRVKLIDFGAARYATTDFSRSLTVIIKPGYSPEEQYRSRGDQGSYTDVYAISATLYRMVTGITPPDALERRAFFENMKKDILKPPNKLVRGLTVNQETAILNALNVQVDDRTPDMATFAKELTTSESEKVTRLYGKIKKIDVLRWPLWAKIGAPAAMLLVVAVGILLALGFFNSGMALQENIIIAPGMSRVPSVINDDVYQAEERLTIAMLQFIVGGRDYSDVVQPSLVLTQNINAGTVVIYNTIVEVLISAAWQEIVAGIVPDVRFMTEEEAGLLIIEAGLAIEATHEYSDTVAYGLVISQDPAMGTVLEIGEPVTIVVSKGSPAFAMPDVVGMDAGNARDVLVASGLVASVSYENDDTVPEGTVVWQDIAPDTLVNRGDTISIVVSSGRELIPVADITGITQADAADTLRAQGFEVVISEAASDTVGAGYVVSQLPTAGASLVEGVRVVITVSTGPVAVPEVPAGVTPVATPTPVPTPSPAPVSTPAPTINGRLPAPQNLAWGLNFALDFDGVPQAEGSYRVRIFRDGVEVFNGPNNQGMYRPRVSLFVYATEINESGTYQFAISAVYDNRYDHPNNSAWAYSPTIVYTRPTQSLGAPTNLRWESRASGYYAVWDMPHNATNNDFFRVYTYVTAADGTSQRGGGLTSQTTSRVIPRVQDGMYFRVRPISRRLEVVANGVPSAPSPRLQLGDTTGTPAPARSARAAWLELTGFVGVPYRQFPINEIPGIHQGALAMFEYGPISADDTQEVNQRFGLAGSSWLYRNIRTPDEEATGFRVMNVATDYDLHYLVTLDGMVYAAEFSYESLQSLWGFANHEATIADVLRAFATDYQDIEVFIDNLPATLNETVYIFNHSSNFYGRVVSNGLRIEYRFGTYGRLTFRFDDNSRLTHWSSIVMFT